MSLLPADLCPSWKGFLSEDILTILTEIEAEIGEETNPPKPRVLRFMTTDFEAVKIVILGQDPYPEKGVATGRSFEVGNLTSWDRPFRQVSLKNIIRLIYKNYKDIVEYKEIPPFSHIVREIENGRFRLANPQELFARLEAQGVLFLNTWLSIKPGEPESHRKYWQPFSERLISYMSNKRPELIWFLWGKNASQFKPFIKQGRFYESRHPMMCSEIFEDDFLKSNCFKETMNLVNWTGK